MTTRDERKVKGGVERRAASTAALAAIGLEAEFTMLLDGEQVKPEDVFGSPRKLVRGPLMHRTGRSYHLPTGGAMYFDTGVIELATPVIEIDRGCAARAGRSLWESIRFVRRELDAWEQREGHTVHLAGFSTHYNVSLETTGARRRGGSRSADKLAMLLLHIIPFPVMLLAANRRSTGIGVRPRPNRIEVTADFTPDASLMIAAATFIVAVVREVMAWPSFELDALDATDIPVVRDFVPEPHSSRRGWVARFTSFVENPFVCDVNAAAWPVRSSERPLSLRQIARRVTDRFWPSICRLGDPRSVRLIESVMRGTTPSLLELDDRPPAYERVGTLCTWANLFPVRALPRSRYERVFIRAISGHKLRLRGDSYTPTGMRGWSHVVFDRDRDHTRHVFSLDYLLRHLDRWELGPRAERRLRRSLRNRLSRRSTDATEQAQRH
ncbi:MAG TPA: hypothetical protein VNC18_16590 [Gemmatimonadaceae bacterium]|nr:hypothetical protein [Gemmatimonadaceae bacterium]